MLNIPKLLTFSATWALTPVDPQTRKFPPTFPTFKPSARSVGPTPRICPEPPHAPQLHCHTHPRSQIPTLCPANLQQLLFGHVGACWF